MKIVETELSPNCTKPRNHSIDTITPHCVDGNLTVKNILHCFINPSSKASCNYAIDSRGNIGMGVEERNRAWTSSSSDNDNRAITVEIANDGGADTGYHMSDKAIESFIELCVDICMRYGKTCLYFDSDKSKAHRGGTCMRITLHRWFKNKACPGDYLISRLPYICSEASKRLTQARKIYRVQLGAFTKKENAERLQSELRAKGYDCIIV